MSLLNRKINHYRFPWRDNNAFRLLTDGNIFFPAMLEAINRAQHQILVEMYLIESGKTAHQFIDALIKQSEKNINVFLLLDDFGARGLHKHDRQKIEHSNIQLSFFNPLRYGKFRRNLFRDHRKLLVVDDQVAFTGGTGITDDFNTAYKTTSGWHEVMIEIQGPVIADWQTLFFENWNRWVKNKTGYSVNEISDTGQQSGRVTSTGGVTRTEIKRSFLKRIRQAERRVWMATAYFVPSWKLIRALKQAARNGCDVRLLLPGRHTDHPAIRHAGRRYYSHLLRNGVRIFEYQPRFLHAKVLLCDQWVSIGSSNIDRWNLRWNLEANQEVDDQSFAHDVTQLFEKDFAHSKEYIYDKWKYRPWYKRFMEWFWGKIDRWLEKRGQKKGG
ncbi:MAG: phospholipase D-like domain-containing protein [Gammaproteobacteria bacterium]|nr:phospholipase D-like domain-containing protein [Gammaproteobacteria bacterium]MDH5593731.1 phospholipase D-like domain-containing protein [Gammaproteobacteria bacterium]MDH5613920.1 phospholipase D-like domain-containing protein [Gammaproteobacteria bacterium]